MTRRPTLAAAVLGALTLASGACSAPSAPLPPGPQVVDVTMREYSFDYDAAALFTGRVTFHVTNAGQQPHRLAVVGLPDDMPPLADQIRGSERRVIDAIADLPTMQPGAKNVFSLGLPPGRWALISFYAGGDGASDATKGMFSEFRVARQG